MSRYRIEKNLAVLVRRARRLAHLRVHLDLVVLAQDR